MSYVIKAPFRATDNRDLTEVERDLRAQVEALQTRIQELEPKLRRQWTITHPCLGKEDK